MKFQCYLSETGDNPLLDAVRACAVQMATFDALTVDIVKHEGGSVQAYIYLNGKLIAHSAARET